MLIWGNPVWIIIMTMIRLLKDWLNWKHNFASCILSLLLLVTVSLKLIPVAYCQLQNQHNNNNNNKQYQEVLPKVNHGLRSWDNDDSSNSLVSGSNGYFLQMQKFARPFQHQKLQYLQSFIRQGLNDYDGLADLQAKLSASSSSTSSSASVDDDVYDGILERALQSRDIPQITFNCGHDNGDEGQGRRGVWDKECNYYGGAKIKRSIGLNGLGPIRVFKYISEDHDLQSLSGDDSIGIGDNVLHEKKTDVGSNKQLNAGTTATTGNFNKPHPNKNSKSKSQYYSSDLKSSTVTDRSLIPNSYFGSAPESQKNNQTDNQQVQDKPTSTPATTTSFNGTSTTYTFSNTISTPASTVTDDENDPNNIELNSSKMPFAKAYKQIPGGGNKINKDKKLSNRQRVSNAEFLLYNASLSERSRRSPFRNPYYQPILYQQQRFIQQQNLQSQHQQQLKQQQQQQRISQIQQSNNNRAALYMRNNNGMHLPPNAAQAQAFQMSRFKLTVPQQQPKKNSQDIQPSSSNDYFNYRLAGPQVLPYPTDPKNIPESSWNHPMYRRYSKVAKRVQNKVSGAMGIGNFGKGQGSQSHNSRRDFPNSKGRPIPLPRPKPSNNNNNKGRRIRSRNRLDSNGNIRYSYPKSAQNIQDILNHFQQDNNDLLDSVAKPTKSSPYGGSENGRGSNHGVGPGSISDLSSELKDVRFSLLRDIREFAKRPNDMSSPHHHHRNHDEPSNSNRFRDEPYPKRAPFYSEDHLQNAYRTGESKSYHNNNNHNNNNNEDDGYDEMTDPKPKPVRDMVKTSSRFREESERDRDSSSSLEKEFQHSKKRDRDPHYKDHRDSDSEDHQGPPYYGKHYSNKNNKFLDEDSTERYLKPNREDRYKNDRPIRHHNSGERQRHRPRRPSSSSSGSTSKEDRVRDRDHSYSSKERPKRLRGKFSHRDDVEDFNSFEVRNSNPYNKSKELLHNNRNKELMDYPKNIRDKIQEVSGEFDRHTNKVINKPIVIKRPYEPYRIPPAMINFEIPKKSSEQEYWNNYASATEKNLYEYNPKLARPQPPLIISSPTGGYTPRYGAPTQYHRPKQTITNPEEEDILEIHTGGQPSNHAQDNKSLQKAYMELLQHKMQTESALLNAPHSSSPSRTHPTKPKKAPMRMKIHIYPNNEAGVGVTEMTSHNFNTFGNQQQMNYGGSGYSESHPSNMLIAPRDSQKIGGSLRSPQMNQQQYQGLGPGPAPPTLIGYGFGGNSHNNNNNNNNGKPSISSSSISDKNKNLVLHLHVHRRNDAGPVEMEAEASELHTSTAKPLTYKDIFDEHHQQAPVEDPAEPDKSVSMEVPIHDDKIEDVLHTLLQFRDRGGSRKKRNHAAVGADEVT